MKTRSITAMVLAFLVPGGGHFYLGLRQRAIGFFCIIVLLFSVGLMIDGGVYSLRAAQGQLLIVLASLGSMGLGPIYFLAQAMGAAGDVTSATFEYGRTFTLTAGLMNLLLVLDVFDIAIGRKQPNPDAS